LVLIAIQIETPNKQMFSYIIAEQINFYNKPAEHRYVLC